MHRNPLSDTLYHARVIPRRPDIRGDYFRDQTAIIHSTPFRRLKHKTQVFFSPQNDHICTRIEHVLHVSTIATSICKGLGLDVELAQAIALGHDLGHAPFGHAGERILNILAKDCGGFIHEVHGLRVVDKLARDGKGLNLTYAVRDGIASHCGERFEKTIRPETREKDLGTIGTRQSAPLTYEGCVVRVSDIIAYLGRDIEDAVTAGLITLRDIPLNLKKSLGTTNGEIIDTLVLDVIRTSDGTEKITFSDEKFALLCQLKDFNYDKIYHHKAILESDAVISEMVEKLFRFIREQYMKYGLDFDAYQASSKRALRHFGESLKKRRGLYTNDTCPDRCVIDHISGMTDAYAIESARDLMLPTPIH
ncbi:MAG TPA: HD domain-containing protein [bacterium]|nr:HD domain-containing protein [bacterium]